MVEWVVFPFRPYRPSVSSVRAGLWGQDDEYRTRTVWNFVSGLSQIIFIICSTPRSNASRKFNRLFFQFYSYYIFSNILHNFRLDVNFAFDSTPPKNIRDPPSKQVRWTRWFRMYDSYSMFLIQSLSNRKHFFKFFIWAVIFKMLLIFRPLSFIFTSAAFRFLFISSRTHYCIKL